VHSTSLKELSQLITGLKIPPSSTVMIHSSLLKFGIIENGVEGFFQCIIESLAGEPTIVMPAFSFSYFDNRYWDVKKTKSEMGALSEYFRKLNGALRTIHPFHSIVAYGKYVKEFKGCNSLSSFGKNSPFEKLVELNAYNLSLGTEFIGGGTFFHHTEEVCRVPYRHYKEFPGSVYNEEGKMVNKIYKMYVRNITDNYEYVNNWDKVFIDLSKKNCFHIKYLNIAKIIFSSIRNAHGIFKEFIDEDPYYAAERINKKHSKFS